MSPVSEAPSPGHGWILTTGPQEEKDLLNGLVGMMSEGMERVARVNMEDGIRNPRLIGSGGGIRLSSVNSKWYLWWWHL